MPFRGNITSDWQHPQYGARPLTTGPGLLFQGFDMDRYMNEAWDTLLSPEDYAQSPMSTVFGPYEAYASAWSRRNMAKTDARNAYQRAQAGEVLARPDYTPVSQVVSSTPTGRIGGGAGMPSISANIHRDMAGRPTRTISGAGVRLDVAGRPVDMTPGQTTNQGVLDLSGALATTGVESMRQGLLDQQQANMLAPAERQREGLALAEQIATLEQGPVKREREEAKETRAENKDIREEEKLKLQAARQQQLAEQFKRVQGWREKEAETKRAFTTARDQILSDERMKLLDIREQQKINDVYLNAAIDEAQAKRAFENEVAILEYNRDHTFRTDAEKANIQKKINFLNTKVKIAMAALKAAKGNAKAMQDALAKLDAAQNEFRIYSETPTTMGAGANYNISPAQAVLPPRPTATVAPTAADFPDAPTFSDPQTASAFGRANTNVPVLIVNGQPMRNKYYAGP